MAEPVFAWLSEYVGVNPESAASAFAAWRVMYHERHGVKTCAALLKGQEIHFIVAPEWRNRAITRDNARAFLASLLEQCNGMLTTRVLHNTPDRAAFVERIGFKKTWSDERFDYYALCEPPFQRSATT